MENMLSVARFVSGGRTASIIYEHMEIHLFMDYLAESTVSLLMLHVGDKGIA